VKATNRIGFNDQPIVEKLCAITVIFTIDYCQNERLYSFDHVCTYRRAEKESLLVVVLLFAFLAKDEKEEMARVTYPRLTSETKIDMS
jgi:hypothetical protein